MAITAVLIIGVVYYFIARLARKAMPGAIEVTHHNVLGYSLTDSSFDRICYIAPQPKGYVNFGFFFGSTLPDTTSQGAVF